ncbi:Atu4866 domain-containing protein [Agrobacterium sp. LAD9]|uniref:Atu4866 domain-containing protein n=1 Tax=Agrobacterium sp. LAD9 TaxID=2055153 RepID=UPI001FCE8BAB|nr:Atu4866 domain-containing protein [Agrobacterium sp. LAD9]
MTKAKLFGCGLLESVILTVPLLAMEMPNEADAGRIISTSRNERTGTMQHPYVGIWVTADGRIRQELLPNGRYDEARGNRKSAYQGRYEVRGAHINYWDDTGFTADGDFVSANELHHGGMTFYREK